MHVVRERVGEERGSSGGENNYFDYSRAHTDTGDAPRSKVCARARACVESMDKSNYRFLKFCVGAGPACTAVAAVAACCYVTCALL